MSRLQAIAKLVQINKNAAEESSTGIDIYPCHKLRHNLMCGNTSADCIFLDRSCIECPLDEFVNWDRLLAKLQEGACPD